MKPTQPVDVVSQLLRTTVGDRQLEAPSFSLGTQRLTPKQYKIIKRGQKPKQDPPEPLPSTSEEVEQAALEAREYDFADTWDGDPVWEQQYVDERHRDTWKQGPVVIETFDLTSATDLTRLNNLLEQAEPPGAPRIVLQKASPPIPSNTSDRLTLILPYRRVLYRKATKPD